MLSSICFIRNNVSVQRKRNISLLMCHHFCHKSHSLCQNSACLYFAGIELEF